jgi:undecaprenyl-diphosphatase
VFEGDVSLFDSVIRDGFQKIANPVFTAIMIFFTYLGSVYGIVSLFVIALLLLYVFDQKRATALLSITMSGEAVLGIVLKLSFQRPRPEAFFGFEPPASYSFPSGHAFASLCFFGALAWIATTQIKSTGKIILVWLIAAFFILIIGSSRIYLGVHYPSDILAGYLAGVVWLSAVYSADHRLRNRDKNES